jgi:hypothetical protein
MGSEPTNDKIELLEQRAVKYAIAVESREAIHSYLKYWSTLLGAVAIAAGWFGLSLHGEIEKLNSVVSTQTQHVSDLEKQTKQLEATVAASQTIITAQTKEVIGKEAELDARTEKLYEKAGRFSEIAGRFDGESRDTIRRLEDALTNSATSAKLVQQHLDEVKTLKQATEASANGAKTDAGELHNLMTRARNFDHDIDTHRKVFRNALLDYVTMTSKAHSPDIILTTPEADTYYRVRFHTPRSISSGFTLSYDVTKCRGKRTDSELVCGVLLLERHGDRIIEFVKDRRDWHDIDGTDDQYQFAVDYVFISVFARNFVTIRVGATDKLLRESEAATSPSETASTAQK